MVFKLTFDIPEADEKLNYREPILLMGSCFSDEIGAKLTNAKCNVISNPFGTIYNPISIFRSLLGDLPSTDIIENQSVFYHWHTHSQLSALNKGEIIEEVNRVNKETQQFLKSVEWLIITLGTAWVYDYPPIGTVANCHKIPQKVFNKRLLKPDEIIQHYTVLSDQLKKLNPNLKVIFTLSPVRHIRDGLVENNRSKSILLNAIHTICDTSNAQYFPSYEILMDELRDYRFYKKDMIHPSEEAIDYVWQQFTKTYLDKPSLSFLKEWNSIQSDLNHRAFQPKSKNHQAFLKATLKKLEKLNEKVDVRVEIKNINSQII